MPDNEKWQEWRTSLINLRDGVKDNIDLGKYKKYIVQNKNTLSVHRHVYIGLLYVPF